MEYALKFIADQGTSEKISKRMKTQRVFNLILNKTGICSVRRKQVGMNPVGQRAFYLPIPEKAVCLTIRMLCNPFKRNRADFHF